MEVLIMCFFIALATIVFPFVLTVTARKKKKQLLPPGPWSLPLIGSLHHLLRGGLPHHTMRELSRRHGPLMFLRLGEVPTLVVSSAEAAELVMKTHDLVFSSRPSSVTIDIVGCRGKGIALAPYGDQWRQMKKICIMELLSAKQVKRVESIRVDEVGRLLRSVAAAAASGLDINLSVRASALANDIVAMAMFGGTCAEEKSEFVMAYDQVSELMTGFLPLDFFPSSWLVQRLSTTVRRLLNSYGRIHGVIARIVESRKDANVNQEDLLGVLLRLQMEDSLAFPITPETIGAIMFDIFGGAITTLGYTVEWAIAELLRKPDFMAKAQLEVRTMLGASRGVITNTDLAGLDYLQMVIKEVLRLHPPNPMLVPRESREDCEIMGYHIPKGTRIYINTFAISRDPRYWDNPEAFNPERFQNNNVDFKGAHFEFTPFGAGRRQCPAILFGTSAMEITLANLLYHFDWVLADESCPDLLDMTETFGLGVRKKLELHLRAVPYVHYYIGLCMYVVCCTLRSVVIRFFQLCFNLAHHNGVGSKKTYVFISIYLTCGLVCSLELM